MVAFATSCTTQASSRPGDPAVLYHHNWWNYYERGTYYLSQGQVEEARADFERCLGLRPGAAYEFAQDTWRARTYGLHILEEYFPHREMGICLLLLGRTDEAVQHLQTSLRQAPSGRAKFYLNEARRRRLQARRVPPPSISIDAPSRSLWTRERRRTLSGSVYGPGYVEEVQIGRTPQFIELASPHVSFRQDIQLAEGANTIPVEAVDLTGGRAEKTVRWVADWKPPKLYFKSVQLSGAAVEAQGFCADESGLTEAKIESAGRVTRLVPRGTAPKRVAVSVTLSAGEPVRFAARDPAGNEISIWLSAEALRLSHAGGMPRVYAAENGGGVPDVPASPGAAHAGAGRSGPRLRLSTPPGAVVFKEELVIEGTADDAAGLASITINGDELLAHDEKGALSCSFARRMPLQPGTNIFHLRVRGTSGDDAEQVVSALRKIPSYLDKQYRLSVALPPLVARGAAAAAERIRRLMEQELVREPVRFFLLERGEGWPAVLRELALSVSDLSDPRAALTLGRVLPVEMILVGLVLPNAAGTTVYAMLVDVESGDIVADDDVYSEALGQELGYKVAGLIMKIEQRFPLAEGRVLSRRAREATISAGAEAGIHPGMRFLVIHSPGRDAPIEEGLVRKVGEELVELKITKVGSDQGTARVNPPAGEDCVAAGDFVYAR